MKLTNLINLMVLGSVLTMTAVGCKTKPLKPTPIPGPRVHPTDPNGNLDRGQMLPPPINPNGSDVNSGTPPNAGDSHPGWIENTDALKAQTLYFEFDKASIKTSEQSKLDDVANYLKSNASAAVKVEGNCDERGTEEYNRSLGERRALAAREYLIRLGIDPSRVDTISFGEDKPAETGHSEAAWSKNRRDDFVVLTPPRM